MKNSLCIHKWTHNEFNIFILGVLTHPRLCMQTITSVCLLLCLSKSVSWCDGYWNDALKIR